MRILLCNDDGYQAPGLVALHAALSPIAEVQVVAPEHNNSAKSNALTLNAPLYVHTAPNGSRYVNGTPADCVHIALTGLLGEHPDLVISGINNGANMGDDTLYSGTVARPWKAISSASRRSPSRRSTRAGRSWTRPRLRLPRWWRR